MAGDRGATIETVQVFLFALATAVATGLGVLPFVFFRRSAQRWHGVSNAAAAGLMLAASFRLFDEGATYGLARMLLGLLLGLWFILSSHRVLERRRDVLQMGSLRGADAVKGLMFVGIMTLHSLTEGVGVGVAFGGGLELGLFITAAIAVHNVPEGLAISLVLVPRGESVWRAASWSVFSSLPQPLLAVPAFLFVEVFRPLLPVGLGFAGGAMLWMVFAEIVPEALRETSRGSVAVAVTLAAAAMVAIQTVLAGGG
ncbi:MAG: ZIP family metal transporter [Gemmatimonadota bacterium]